uniref:Uncharacterized protein n=1 Tax=Oryza rufipogon TaxID=4529 RepID=A0A0E0P9X8_ORYRU
MDLGKPKPAVLLSPPSPAETAVGAERSIHHRTPCHHRIRVRRRRIRSLHRRRRQPRRPAQYTTAAVAHCRPTRSGRSDADLAVYRHRFPGRLPWSPKDDAKEDPCHRRPCGCTTLPAATRAAARWRREVGKRRGGRVVASRAAPRGGRQSMSQTLATEQGNKPGNMTNRRG